jgi:hypothetical protein
MEDSRIKSLAHPTNLRVLNFGRLTRADRYMTRSLTRIAALLPAVCSKHRHNTVYD